MEHANTGLIGSPHPSTCRSSRRVPGPVSPDSAKQIGHGSETYKERIGKAKTAVCSAGHAAADAMLRIAMVRSSRRLPIVGVALALLLCLAVTAAAQRRGFFYGWDETVKNVPYDGRFTFVRIRYTPAPGGYWAGGRPSWVHGYPVAEQNLMRIMKEVSS